jgi:hypothetical protein
MGNHDSLSAEAGGNRAGMLKIGKLKRAETEDHSELK